MKTITPEELDFIMDPNGDNVLLDEHFDVIEKLDRDGELSLKYAA